MITLDLISHNRIHILNNKITSYVVSKKTGNKVLKTTKEKDSHVGADKSYTDVVLEQTLFPKKQQFHTPRRMPD